MGRKNNRIVKSEDKSFEKFIKNFMKEQGEKPVNNYIEKPKAKEESKPIDYAERDKERLAYAKKQLDYLNIQYHVLNEERTFIECNRKGTNEWIKFYASSGTILGYPDLRGVKALISLLI